MKREPFWVYIVCSVQLSGRCSMSTGLVSHSSKLRKETLEHFPRSDVRAKCEPNDGRMKKGLAIRGIVYDIFRYFPTWLPRPLIQTHRECVRTFHFTQSSVLWLQKERLYAHVLGWSWISIQVLFFLYECTCTHSFIHSSILPIISFPLFLLSYLSFVCTF